MATAHAARKRGWRVIALHGIRPDGTCTCGKASCQPSNHGKHPIDARWQNTPEMSAADVQATFEGQPWNLGIATGAPSGFWVLDIDPDSGGFESARKLQDEYGPMPATVVVQTGSGGWHYYFAQPADFDMRNRQGVLAGIDVRGTGGQVVVPPSVSAKGPYRWAVTPDDVAVAEAPAWLLDMLRPTTVEKGAVYADDVPDRSGMTERERARLDRYAGNIIEREVARLDECRKAATVNGQGYRGPAWNSTTFEVACTLVQLANSPWCELTQQGAYDLLMKQAPRDRDFNDKAVEDRFDSAVAKVGNKARPLPVDRGSYDPRDRAVQGPVDPFEDPTGGVWAAGSPGSGTPTPPAAPVRTRQWPVRTWDDLGNAARVVDHYGDRLRWVKQAKAWAIYEGGRWVLDESELGRALIQDMIESLPKTEAFEYPEFPADDDDAPKRADFLKWVKSQRMSARVSACITESAGRRELQAKITSFDREPMLLNVANGVVDLATGELRQHDPNLLLMQQSPANYDPAAQAPRWEKFLLEVMPNPDMRAYLQRIVGYSLTGKMGERAMFIHHGSGANGKSVFLQVASAFAGLYGQTVPREALMTRPNGSPEHPAAIARMVGKRFLQASETAHGRRLDEEMVKGLTGGEEQSARYMGKDWFDFTPTGKIHLITNHLPRLTDAESIWSRLHLVGWRVVIPPEERDPELANRIIAEELPGVLAWAVRGALEWQRTGLNAPAVSKVDLSDYRHDQDEFGDFLMECITRDENGWEAVSGLYASYQAWANRSGIRNWMKLQDFRQTLKDRGFETQRKAHGRGFRGLRINPYGRPLAEQPGVVVITDDTKVANPDAFDPFEQ